MQHDPTDRSDDAEFPARGVGDEAEGAQHVPDATKPPRRDPHPDEVPGPEDAGAQGRDRDTGGWGDRGIGGGRAGGTGLRGAECGLRNAELLLRLAQTHGNGGPPGRRADD
jgi:hypothetical protein